MYCYSSVPAKMGVLGLPTQNNIKWGGRAV